MPDVREKLVELLCEAHSKATDAEAFADATYAQQLEMEADHLIANGVTIQRWIPVEERFPDVGYGESENVLTYNEFGMEHILYFDGGCWNYPDGEVYDKPFHITHWMPLPEPPKEE